MKILAVYIIYFLTFPIFLHAQYTGGTGNGDASISLTNSHLNVKLISLEIPSEYKLFQNYPNPFNPETKIKFQIRNAGLVSLNVYDILGREISTLLNEKLQAGTYEIPFRISNNYDFSSGVYFYKLTVNNHTMIKNMIFTK